MWKVNVVKLCLPLAHNIITIDTIKTSKYSLLAAILREALLSSPIIARKISNQKTNKYATQTPQ